MGNIEEMAAAYATKRQAHYIKKRGGKVLAHAALQVWIWAFNRFMIDPEGCEAEMSN